MARTILLDAGVIGLLCSSPKNPVGVRRLQMCEEWLDRLDIRTDVAITDLSDFEVRRELIRLAATAKLARLDDLRRSTVAIWINRDSWIKAAEFWAELRRTGLPTAGPDALDGDAILAGVAATIAMPGDEVIIATTNVRHPSRFPGVIAQLWEEIS